MNKKLMFILIIVIIGTTLLIMFFLNKKNKVTNSENEYMPEEEISLSQERETMLTLYFKNKSTNTLEPEVRLIDVKSLVDDPYKTILNLLIEGPKNENLETVIPSGTKINNVSLNGDTLIIDFSSEFINNHPGGKDLEEQTINSIVNTMTELAEINSIKILIDGEEGKSFSDNLVDFKNAFTRTD